jgi:DNA-binding NtrC family response regulator
MEKLRVFSASSDANLNDARALLLRQHGFDVTTSESSDHAQQQLKSSTFDVLIFGATLPHKACWDLAAAFRQSNAAGRIIEILPTRFDVPKNQPDSVVVSDEEATRLITTIRESSPKSKFDQQMMDLTSRARMEQNSQKLMDLVDEINRLLDSRGKPPNKD